MHWVPIIEVQRYKVEIVGAKPSETHQQVATGCGKVRKDVTTICQIETSVTSCKENERSLEYSREEIY